MYVLQWLILGFTVCTIGYVWSEELESHQVSVQKCCPPGQGLLSNHSCVAHDGGPIEITVNLPRERNTTEAILLGEKSRGYNCTDDEVIHLMSLNQENYITHFDGKTFFRWMTSEGEEWSVDAFCVAPAAAGDDDILDQNPQYLVEFCYDFTGVHLRDDEAVCNNVTCVRKCCPGGMMLFNETCQPPTDDSRWIPEFYSSEDYSTRVQEPSDLLFVYGFPICPISLNYGKFRLLDSGLVHTMSDLLPTIPPKEYCIDTQVDSSGEVKDVALACYIKEDHYCQTRHIIVDLVLMIVSCICLVINWLIYVRVARLRTNNYGRCMIAFLTALFIVTLASVINRNQKEPFSDVPCTFIAILNHLGVLASFFWLNVLCFHIWFCLRSGKRREENRLYIAYSFYGWGIPLVIALIGAYKPPNDSEVDIPRADYLPADCWFKGSTQRWIFLYGFMLGFLFLNVVLFLSSVVMATRKQSKLREVLHQTDGMRLNLRLLIIMGITWLAELIPWTLEANLCKTWVSILDGLTALYGVYILVATVCWHRHLQISKICGKKTYDVAGNQVPGGNELSDTEMN